MALGGVRFDLVGEKEMRYVWVISDAVSVALAIAKLSRGGKG